MNNSSTLSHLPAELALWLAVVGTILAVLYIYDEYVESGIPFTFSHILPLLISPGLSIVAFWGLYAMVLIAN